jgi:hypothetical protein
MKKREKGWYWVKKIGFYGEHGAWTPALWSPELTAWYSLDFRGVPDTHIIVGEKLEPPPEFNQEEEGFRGNDDLVDGTLK